MALPHSDAEKKPTFTSAYALKGDELSGARDDLKPKEKRTATTIIPDKSTRVSLVSERTDEEVASSDEEVDPNWENLLESIAAPPLWAIAIGWLMLILSLIITGINLKLSIDLYRSKTPKDIKKYNDYLVIGSWIFCAIFVVIGLLLGIEDISETVQRRNFAKFPALFSVIFAIILSFFDFKFNKLLLLCWMTFCAVVCVAIWPLS